MKPGKVRGGNVGKAGKGKGKGGEATKTVDVGGLREVGARGEEKRARYPGVPQDLIENLDIEGKTNRSG